MSKADYKSKYIDIRDKFIESTDVAYRMGFEHGMDEGQKQAEQQAQQAQAEMAAQQAQAMGGEEGMPPEQGGEMPPEAQEGMPEGMPEEGAAPEEMGEQEAAELDDRINELESLVAKGEKPKVTDLRKAVIELAGLRKKQKESFTKKSRKNVSKQKQFVDSIISKWEDESKSVTEDLESVLKEKGIKLDD